MSKFYVFLIGLAVLVLVSRIQPIRRWSQDFFSQKKSLAFMLPMLVLFGWPIDNIESFRTGADLGWQRVARIIIFIGFFCFYVYEIIRKPGYKVPLSAPVILFFLYSLYAGISTLYSPEPMQTAWKSFELLVVLMFGLSLYQGCRNNPMNAVSLVNGLVYIAFALCLMSIVGGIVAPEHAWRDWGLLGLGERSMAGVAPMINPNMLGQLGAIVFLIGIAGWFRLKESFRKGLLLVLFAGLSTLFLAYSRTSIVSTVIIMIVLLALMRKASLLTLFLPFFAMASIFFADSFLSYLSRGQSTEEFMSMSGRIGMWEAAIESWKENIWFGGGFFVGHKYVQNESGHFLATTDNTYIETLVNLGVFGFIIITMFSLSLMLASYRKASACGAAEREIVFCALAAFVIISVTIARSMTASSFQVLHYSLLFVIVSLIAVIAIKR